MIPFEPTADEIKNVIPIYTEIGTPKSGGMKIFYPATRPSGHKEALKLAFIPSFGGTQDPESPARQAEVRKRVEREIRVLAESTSPFIVKLGELPPTSVQIRNEWSSPRKMDMELSHCC